MKQERSSYLEVEREALLGKIIKKFNFINEPYIIYPHDTPQNKEEKNPKELKKEKITNRGELVPDEKKLKSIYDDAFKKGMEDGFAKGRDTGIREGKIEGEKIGREEGFNLGYKDGFEKGKKEGFEKGYEEGLKRGEEEFKHAISSFVNAVSKVQEDKEEFVNQIQKKILDFAFKFAEVIVKREINKDDDIVVDILKEALQYIVLDGNMIIKVNMADIEKVEEYINHNLSLLEKDINISVIGDETLERGSVMVVGQSGEIDARIERMVERARESLVG